MSLFKISDLSKEEILNLIKRAQEFKNGKKTCLDVSIANIFLEPSTRTLVSFQKAQKQLGMDVYNLDMPNSSFKKNESLEDTLINLKAMGINNFVIRSKEESYWSKFDNTDFNIANGGDGIDSHPSQALLDAMTIFEKFGTLNNLNVLFIGDTTHSRVFHSLDILLKKFDSKTTAITPTIFGGSDKDISENLNDFDVVVLLRIQHERHSTKASIENYNETFGLNKDRLNQLGKDAIFMHPGPVNRGVEITDDIMYDSDKSRIFEQVKNGVFMRMAILEAICKNI